MNKKLIDAFFKASDLVCGRGNQSLDDFLSNLKYQNPLLDQYGKAYSLSQELDKRVINIKVIPGSDFQCCGMSLPYLRFSGKVSIPNNNKNNILEGDEVISIGEYLEVYSTDALESRLPRHHKNITIGGDNDLGGSLCTFRVLPTIIDRMGYLFEMDQSLQIEADLKNCSHYSGFNHRTTSIDDVKKTIDEFCELNVCHNPFPRN